MKFAKGLPRILLWTLSLSLMGLALLVSLARQLLPLVAEYREEVAAQVAQTLGVPVSIGQLEADWIGLSPRLVVHDLRIGSGESLLNLGQVEAIVDIPSSLQSRSLRLGSLNFQALALGLEEDATGAWYVAGMPRDSTSPPVTPEQILRLLQHVQQINLYDSRLDIRALDEPQHSLSQMELSLDIEGEQLALNARARLPDGQALVARLDAQVAPDTWREQSNLKAYVRLPASNWATWLPKRLSGVWRVEHLHAGAELWLDWQGQALEQAALRVQAPLLKLGHASRPAVALHDLSTTLHLRHQQEGYQVLVERLGFAREKQRWHDMQLSLKQQSTPAGTALWQAQLDYLDIAALTPLVQQLLPLSSGQETLLKDLSPVGVLRNISLNYAPDAPAAQRLQYSANLEKISFSAHDGIPAVGNVTGSISGDIEQGELRFNSEQFSLHLSDLFPEAWRYQQAGGRIGWKVDDQSVTLIAPFLQLKGEEGLISGDFLIRLYHDPKAESYMDLRVGMREGDSRFAGRYLPTRTPAMSKDLVTWLNSAIQGGRIEQGYFQYQGSLNSDSPPKASSLSLYFKVSDIELDYQKDWPRLRDGRGEVLVEDSGTRVYLSEGRILNSHVQDLVAQVPYAPADQASHLLLKGNVQGRVADGLDILRAAPLDAEDIFNSWQGDGLLSAQLDLDIPLDADMESKVVADFSTQGATLVMAQPDLRLEQLSGKFRYDSAKGVSASSMEARVLGGKVKARLIEAGHAGDPIGRIEAWGDVSVDRLGKWLGLTQKPPATGQLPFQLMLSLADQDSQLQIESSLEGLAIDLPAPFGKAASERRDTSLRMTLHGRERRYWVEYADLASLSFAAPPDKLNKGRGELRLGGGLARLPTASGLRVQGSLATLDVADWQQWLQRSGFVANGANSGASASLLNSVQLNIGRVTGFGQRIDNLDLNLNRYAQGWQLGVNSDVFAGQVSRPDAVEAPLNVKVRHVRLPADHTAKISQTAEDPLANFDPHSLPAMDIAIQSVQYGAESFGSWALKLRPVEGGLAFSDVSVNLKGLKVDGRGGWKQGRSWYKGRLQGDNLATVLKAWGFAPSVTSERFRVDIDGHWPGSPAALDTKRFSGTLRPSFQRGQFVEMEPQALRMFGLLNFEAIGRRLRLDFTDLIGKGLSYDEVKGLLSASNGVYSTREPLSLVGPSSNLELNGTLDLAHERIDAKLLVTLPLTDNLPLAAVIAGAPAVGGAIWAVDRLLGSHVSRFATVQYRVKGPWLSPDISFDKPFEKPDRS